MFQNYNKRNVKDQSNLDIQQHQLIKMQMTEKDNNQDKNQSGKRSIVLTFKIIKSIAIHW